MKELVRRASDRTLETVSATAYKELAALDLDLIRANDGQRAREAFERLWSNTRRGAMAHLRRCGVFGEEAEEIEIVVLGQLWKRRAGVRATTLAEWYALVRTALTRQMIKHGARVGHQLIEDVPLAETPYLQAIMEAAEERGLIYSLADNAWLGEMSEGVDPLASAAAAQFVYVDGLSIDEAASILRVDCADVCHWLSLPAVIARAVFYSLCWESDVLAAHLIREEPPLSEQELDRIANGDSKASELGVWTEVEARVICLHVRNALHDEEIARLFKSNIGREELGTILEKIIAAYPFRRIAKSVKTSDAKAVLGKVDLWRRVAFEYYAHHELPRKQILERAAPPAEEGGVALSNTTLDSWIGQGRLWARLAADLKERVK